MLFRFIGNGDSDPETIALFGYEFGLHGDPVDVDGEHAIMKLTGSTHFEKVEPKPATNGHAPRNLGDMKMGELRAVGRDRGITFPVGTTKATVLEALNVGD